MNATQIQSSSSIYLEKCRQEIDVLDTQLIQIIAQRMEIVKKIGLHKKQHHIQTIQPNRWQTILDSRKKIAQELDLSSHLVLDIFEIIHKMAIEVQTK